MRFARSFSALAAAALFGIAGPAAAFCGFFVSGADAKLYNNASQVVLMRKGNHTVMTMSNNYKGPPEDFAMVIPVPVVLQKDQVHTLPPTVFQHIEQLTAPRLVEYWEQDPCNPQSYGLGGGWGRMGGRAAAMKGAFLPAKMTAASVYAATGIALASAALNTWRPRRHTSSVPSDDADQNRIRRPHRSARQAGSLYSSAWAASHLWTTFSAILAARSRVAAAARSRSHSKL